MKSGAFLFILLILSIILIPVNAATCGNATFSTLGQGGSEDILVYNYDVTNNTQLLLGQWNTSSPAVPIPCGDFNIVVRPSAVSRFFNPGTMLADGFAFVETWWIQIGVILTLIAAFWYGGRR
jgi:hypothetical protein